MSNPGKPDGGETQKACAKPHVSFENEYLQCVLGEGHKGLHAAKSAFGGTLQWHDNLAPSPQPSAEATEPTLTGWNMCEVCKLQVPSKCTCDEKPAPSGETQGTCELCAHSLEGNNHGFDQNDAEMDGDRLVHYGRCTYCKICNPRKPLAPEATTKDQR